MEMCLGEPKTYPTIYRFRACTKRGNLQPRVLRKISAAGASITFALTYSRKLSWCDVRRIINSRSFQCAIFVAKLNHVYYTVRCTYCWAQLGSGNLRSTRSRNVVVHQPVQGSSITCYREMEQMSQIAAFHHIIQNIATKGIRIKSVAMQNPPCTLISLDLRRNAALRL